MIITLALLAALCYGTATLWLWRLPGSPDERWPVALALVLHTTALSLLLLRPDGLSIGWTEALALFAWQSSLLLFVFSLRQSPLRPLGLGVYPVAGAFVLIAALWPSTATAVEGDWTVRVHILLSLLSAGLLTLAAMQATLLAAQEQWLHQHQAPALMRKLPPVMTMERLLFQLVSVGFILLSAALLSGLWFLDDWLAQHLAHKTVLSITAWVIFGGLLWGRWQFGLRGRVATRWTLAGYAVLILAYFGSKLVLELMLGAHWTAD